MRQLLAALVILSACTLLPGCGQTGPLYMPDQPAPEAGDSDGTEADDPADGGPTPIT